MSLDDQPKNEAPHGAGVGTTPRGWGSGRQRGWVRGLSRLDFGVKASVLPGVYLAGEEPQLLGAGQGFRGQLVGENHHLCLQTIETPSQAVSLLSPPPPHNHRHHRHGPGLELHLLLGVRVCLMGDLGVQEANTSFPVLSSLLTRSNFMRLGMEGYGCLEHRIPMFQGPWLHEMLTGFKGWISTHIQIHLEALG